MDHYVVTGFDESYWNHWGESWIISLNELAKFDGNILVVDFGLTNSTKNKLVEMGAYILAGKPGNMRAETLRVIGDFSTRYPGIYAIWDADVYFQKPIDEIFELAKDQLVITDNIGFLAGHQRDLVWLCEAQEMVSFIYGDVFIFDYLKSFPQKYLKINNTWNFTDVAKIIDDQKVIHPQGKIKLFLTAKNILFWERYQELYRKHVAKHIGIKLIKK